MNFGLLLFSHPFISSSPCKGNSSSLGFSARALTVPRRKNTTSHEELSQFIYLPEVVGVLGEDCINAVISLQENLRSKESKLAGYMRTDIKSCMDACTTSPVDGNNRVIKHGPSFINSRMNLDKTMARLMKGVNNRLQRRRNRARRELNETNNASCAPTKDFVIRKGQALIDRNYDARLH